MEDKVFHERFRAAVKDSGKTVKELSEMAGVNKRTIEKWLGNNPPVPKVIEFAYVAKVLGFSVDYFIFGITGKNMKKEIAEICEDLAFLPDDCVHDVKGLIQTMKERLIKKRTQSEENQIHSSA